MSRVRNWARDVEPGAPPPPPSVRELSVAPSTVYPSSSVSNPDASRYHRRRTASLSTPSRSQYHHHSSSSSSRRDRDRDDYYSGSSHRSSRRSATVPVPMTSYPVRGGAPIVARTVSPDGRTDSYVIIPGRGQTVEVIHPNTSRSRYHGETTYTIPPISTSSYSRSSPSSPSSSHSKSKSLFRKVLDKVEWGSSKSRSRTGSISSAGSGSQTITYSSSGGRRGRRNSTGSGGSWTLVSGGHVKTVASGTTVKSGGRKYDVYRV